LENRRLLAADLIYNWNTGNVQLDAAEADGQVIVNFVLSNGSSRFQPVSNPFPEELAGSSRAATSISTANEISWTDATVLVSGPIWQTQPGTGQPLDLGQVFPKSLEQNELAAFLTQATYVGTPGTGVQEFDLIVNKPFPWQNPLNPRDINRDMLVTPVGDVLPLINELNDPAVTNERGALPVPPAAPPVTFYDVNGDNFLTPAGDVLPVINLLNDPPIQEGESPAMVDGELVHERHPNQRVLLDVVTNDLFRPWQLAGSSLNSHDVQRNREPRLATGRPDHLRGVVSHSATTDEGIASSIARLRWDFRSSAESADALRETVEEIFGDVLTWLDATI